ncbi:uncharacterized protein BX663DRAFT_561661 [Cokeromyces recurvatus]|uniref:uncharacterized protein n=1 Tax=Cokeromyces recurvatus TaxID=90255 RepID=UPI00222121D5|nr:uncharacterized protein BX663DRAFT_561661 [Cokeromyces recurvatus]KAI7902066.1 hypothetical protein BX663DRAFT_561661 [Cokeromyces recurvatus]
MPISMIVMQSENETNKQASRSASPVPSAVIATNESSLYDNYSTSLPKISSTESSSTDNKKPLIQQKSFPHLPAMAKKKNNSKGKLNHHQEENTHFSIPATTTTTIQFANEKRNQEFHNLFASVPNDEKLINIYGCALQKEILLQGRLFISKHHICFNSNIFGWITNLVIAFVDIEHVEKKTTAKIIPNAISILTYASSKYLFTSFLSRDQAYDQMVECWKALPEPIDIVFENKYDDLTTFSEDSDSSSSDYSTYSSSSSYNNDKNYCRLQQQQISLPTLALNRLIDTRISYGRRRAISETGSLSSIEGQQQQHVYPIIHNDEHSSTHDTSTKTTRVDSTSQVNEKTDCKCNNNQHFPTVIMSNVYKDTTIETIYHVLFHSKFMETFLSQVEKSTDICLGEWVKEMTCVYTRESSYVKHLNYALGPKFTKCLLKEEIHHLDLANSVTHLTVTQTPDVPFGGSFQVKTRTCLSWAGLGQVRLLVTVLVDFTKTSWLKSTIEKASIDGQLSFYKNLDIELRKHLEYHHVKGVNPIVVKKRGKRRDHRFKRNNEQTAMMMMDQDTPSFTLRDGSSDINVPHWTLLLCMSFMILTNVYMAIKMSGIHTQLDSLVGHKHTTMDPYYPTVDSSLTKSPLWDLFEQINSKTAYSRNKQDITILDHPLELSKRKLDKKLAELEKMIERTKQDIRQVTETVLQQKDKKKNSN